MTNPAPARKTWVALVIACAVSGSVHAATFTVNNFGDKSDDDVTDGVCADEDGACSFRAALEQSNASGGADIIQFLTPGTVSIGGVRPEITDSLTIRHPLPGVLAPAVTISGGVSGALIRVNPPLAGTVALVIDGLRFQNPSGQAIGTGAIASLEIRNCVFEGNRLDSGSLSGGALSVQSLTGVIEDSLFHDNSTSITDGGALFIAGQANITVRNTTFSENFADNNGGAIRISGAANVALEDVLVVDNAAGDNGGGIASNTSQTFSAKGLTVFNNTAAGDGGGIWARNDVGGNTKDAVDFEAVNIHGNSAMGNGGGLFMGTGVGLHAFRVRRAAIWNNTAANGGGVYAFGSNDTEREITNTTISQNSITSGATGGLWSTGEMKIIHSTIWDNEGDQIFDVNTGNASVEIGNSIVGFYRSDANGCVKNSFQDPPIQLGPNLAIDASCDASMVGDPRLGAIQTSDGFVAIQPFSESSPARDAANLALCTAAPTSLMDANGPVRPVDGQCDLGAWETGEAVFNDGFEIASLIP